MYPFSSLSSIQEKECALKMKRCRPHLFIFLPRYPFPAHTNLRSQELIVLLFSFA